MIYWLNGEYSKNPDAINIADRGFLLGDGLFETILVVNGVPAFFDAHLERFQAAVTALRLEAEIDESMLGVIKGLVARNKLEKGKAAIRITLSRGAGARGLVFSNNGPESATLLVTITEYHEPDEPSPIRLMVSRHTRCEQSLSSRYKTLNYIDNVMAKNEAAARGCDDAVMLNSAGRAACISAGNIFQILGDERVITPARGEGALDGIVRGILLGGAGEGPMIDESVLESDALERGGLFVANSLIGIRPAILADANRLTPLAADRILRRLQSWYGDALADDLRRRASSI